MSSNRLILEPELLLESYRRNAGNKSATARELGVDRATIVKNLTLYGADRRPVVGGSTKAVKNNILPLPEKGKVVRYVLTSAQNNTKVFGAFMDNLEAYKEWLGDCQIMVARFSYNKQQYMNKQKPGVPIENDSDLWFDPRITDYVCDDPQIHGTCRWQLAPDLFWCAEMQIEPTATRPLSDLQTYTGTASSIFPHTKVTVEPVPTMPGSPTKHIYSTGTVTGKNYIQKKAGLKAQFHHEQAALIVEVNSDGDWWVRHLSADSKGDFYDCPNGKVVKVSQGEVTKGHRAEAINWGDTHVTELPEERRQRYWVGSAKEPAVIDCLKPKYQFHNDLLSFRARSHHEMKSFEKMLRKYLAGDDSVDGEIKNTSQFLSDAEREDCLTVVVNSNHDRHGEKWLDEADYKHDLPNVEFFLEAQLARVKAIKAGEDWMFLEWALRRSGCPETVRFLQLDESFIICKKTHPIECGLHGDLGPNGSRGSTANLSRLGAKANKGHDHSYTKRDGVWSAGTCAEDQGYNHGPTTWSVSHILTYQNGKRTGLQERAKRLWA